MPLKVIILAAGKGTRMRSSLPKVLQPLALKPLIRHVVDTASALACDEMITVVGHGADQVMSALSDVSVSFVEQHQQLGTGHAVQQALPHIADEDRVLILYGDVPLTRAETLQDLLSLVDERHPLALLTIDLEDATGYGRILRDIHHSVQAIVEEKDATASQKTIQEANTGILAASGRHLRDWLSRLSNTNAQGEYYLTDIIAMCVADGFNVHTTQPMSALEVLGVNDKAQLQGLERQYQRALAGALMAQGVTLLDASRVDIRGNLQVGQDVQIDANVVLEGDVRLGNRVVIESNCVIKDAVISDDTVIHAFSHLDAVTIGQACQIGPYARLRPGTELANRVKIGNFVETKKARIGEDSKVNHLSYVGDTLMGQKVNIGAGTITCNYDGVNKHQTVIGNEVFVGSDTQLIAPVTVHDGATIGAGSTITKDAPAQTLTLSRAKQHSFQDWQRPVKK